MKKAELQKIVEDQKQTIEALCMAIQELHRQNARIDDEKKHVSTENVKIVDSYNKLVSENTQLKYRVNKLSEYANVLENDIAESDAKLLEVRKSKNDKIKKIYGQFKHFLSLHKEDEAMINDCYRVMERSSNVIRMLHDQNEHLSDELSMSKHKLRYYINKFNIILNKLRCSEKSVQRKSDEIRDLKRMLDDVMRIRINQSIEVGRLSGKLREVSKNPLLSFIKPRSWFR